MQFDSYIYALFLPLVFVLYWALNRHFKWQNALLLAASYTFYGWWDWRLLGLIVLTSVTTFASGLAIERRPGGKRWWATLSIAINLGILICFKYLNFFRDTAAALLQCMGIGVDWPMINIVLPVGISFYTFQAMSYTIDVYRGEVKATRNLPVFLTYIAFFPQLVAGPIERASHLLPQLLQPRRFDYGNAVVGMRQILWGLAKKVLVADTIGSYLETMMYNPHTQSASTLAMGSLIFAIQIYADFSGYSDIAIGSARLFGIRLTANFKYPFFSRSVHEFWQRWHITLINWFRHYVYYPLGGSRCGKWRTCLNVMIVFTLSGLWHGADVTYLMWGIANGLLVLPTVIAGRRTPDRLVGWRDLPMCALTTVAFAVTLIPFRAFSIRNFNEIASTLVHGDWLVMPQGISVWLFIIPMLVIDWIGRRMEFPLERMRMPLVARWAVYWILLGLIAYYGAGRQLNYIYFQF